MIKRLIKDYEPEQIVTVFDAKEKTFRDEIYPEYKAHRPPTPKDLSSQFEPLMEVLSALGLPILTIPGVEADDVIGTISNLAKNAEKYVIISTGDKDMAQLVNSHISLINTMSNTTMDEHGVFEKFGVKPNQIIDYLTLVGDASDNIPGVPGIGEKTAIKLIKEFGSLENLYTALDKQSLLKTVGFSINQRLKVKLEEYKEQAFFSKKLATIKRDIPIKFDLNKTKWGRFDKEKVKNLLLELDFRSLIERLPESSNDSQAEKSDKHSPNDIKSKDVKRINFLKTLEESYEAGIFSQKIYELEKKLIPVIEEMENNGIKIDSDYFQKLGKKLKTEISGLESKIYKLAEKKFNINSSQQLSEILFNKLKIPISGLRKTPGGVISTAAPELLKLREKHPIISLIEEYRELTKLKSTYVDALPKIVNSKTHKIHTTFNQLGAITGRISSSNPNLQNIPVKGEWGKEIRKAFIVENGFSLVSADYSQIELRIAASLAKDKKMIEAFKRGKDIHRVTASEINNVSEDKVTKEMRREAKILNFGLLYGMSIRSFSESAGVSKERGREFIREYFKDFSGIAGYIENIKQEVRERGFVETLLGRKRFLPQVDSLDFGLKSEAERMAVNMPIQGLAADIIKMAMVRIYEFLADKSRETYKFINLRTCKPVLQVHDELVFEAKDDIIKDVADKIKELMEGIYKIEVPLRVDVKTGKNWGELEEFKSDKLNSND